MVGAEAEAGAEGGVKDGLDLIQATDLSAICPRGRGRAGRPALEEGSAEASDGEVTPTFAPASRGYPDGGGPTQVSLGPPAMDMDPPATGIPVRATPNIPTQRTDKQTKRRSNKCLEDGDGCGP